MSTTGGSAPVSASATALDSLVSTPTGWLKPSPARALGADEIPGVIADYNMPPSAPRTPALMASELHGANGYLIDQFLQDGSNHRTDQYGGSIPNRARLLFEVMDALVSVWGGDRVAIRIGPGRYLQRNVR